MLNFSSRFFSNQLLSEQLRTPHRQIIPGKIFLSEEIFYIRSAQIREKMRIILSSVVLLASVSAFRVTKVEPRLVKVREGQSFRVVCTTDTWYEVRES